MKMEKLAPREDVMMMNYEKQKLYEGLSTKEDREKAGWIDWENAISNTNNNKNKNL